MVPASRKSYVECGEQPPLPLNLVWGSSNGNLNRKEEVSIGLVAAGAPVSTIFQENQ